MTKAVFTTKVDPACDDLPEERYHFPRTYLRQAQAAVGDWIVYYEPRRGSADLSSRGGRQAYFATAKIDRIEPDPIRADHFYAFVSDYLEFEHPVSFKEGERYFEGALARADGKTNKGAFGRAVRSIPDADYDLILQAGFVRTIGEISNAALQSNEEFSDLAEEQLCEISSCCRVDPINDLTRTFSSITAIGSSRVSVCSLCSPHFGVGLK